MVPVEPRFVEALGALAIVGVDQEVGDVLGHGGLLCSDVVYGRFNCQDTPKRSSTHANRWLKP